MRIHGRFSVHIVYSGLIKKLRKTGGVCIFRSYVHSTEGLMVIPGVGVVVVSGVNTG